MKSLFALAALVLLSACNHIETGYRPYFSAQELQARKDLIAFEGEPMIIDGGNPNHEIPYYWGQGWSMIGESRYAENLTASQQLAAKARELKAERVIKFRAGTAVSNSATAVPTGAGMLFMPTTQSVNYYTATFWRRRKPMGTGVIIRSLSQEEAIARGDSNGVAVFILIKGFPGETSGLKVGDIITHIAGTEVINVKDAAKVLEGHTVSTIDYRVLRDGKPQTFTVESLPMPSE